jgi:hypothetical protein
MQQTDVLERTALPEEASVVLSETGRVSEKCGEAARE